MCTNKYSVLLRMLVSRQDSRDQTHLRFRPRFVISNPFRGRNECETSQSHVLLHITSFFIAVPSPQSEPAVASACYEFSRSLFCTRICTAEFASIVRSALCLANGGLLSRWLLRTHDATRDEPGVGNNDGGRDSISAATIKGIFRAVRQQNRTAPGRRRTDGEESRRRTSSF